MTRLTDLLALKAKDSDKGGIGKAELIKEVESAEKWKAQVEKENKKAEKAKEEGKEEEHAGSDGKIKGYLWKQSTSTYANYCYEYLKKKSARNKIFQEFIYLDHSTEFSDLGKKIIRAKFKFIGGFEANFNYNATINRDGKTANMKWPYHWNAHHMIPASAFYLDLESRGQTSKVFKESHIAILLMSNYNVNHGQNMMPLPDNGMDEYQLVHGLLQHPSDHRNYTIKVQEDLKQVAQALEEMEDDNPHPDLKIVMPKKLAAIEDDLWEYIVKLSRKVIGAITSGERPDLDDEEQKVVRFETASKPATEYKFGSLG